jgi:hypothetical protein
MRMMQHSTRIQLEPLSHDNIETEQQQQQQQQQQQPQPQQPQQQPQQPKHKLNQVILPLRVEAPPTYIIPEPGIFCYLIIMNYKDVVFKSERSCKISYRCSLQYCVESIVLIVSE